MKSESEKRVFDSKKHKKKDLYQVNLMNKLATNTFNLVRNHRVLF